MTGKKGKESQREWNRKYHLVRKGLLQPMEYKHSIEEAIAKAGL